MIFLLEPKGEKKAKSEYVNKIENMIHLLCFKVFKNASIWHYVRGNWDSFADDINILKIWILLND